MEILIKAAQLITSLAILVTLHEFGHFIPAKLFKTRVEKFYLFFIHIIYIYNRTKNNVWDTRDLLQYYKDDPQIHCCLET